MQQVFGLVNKLLSKNTETKRRKLQIRRYKVIIIIPFFITSLFNPFCSDRDDSDKNNEYIRPKAFIELIGKSKAKNQIIYHNKSMYLPVIC